MYKYGIIMIQGLDVNPKQTENKERISVPFLRPPQDGVGFDDSLPALPFFILKGT